MTVCIAAVCTFEEKETFVIATDHMIDVGIGQFEHDIRKHKKLNGTTIAMLSGTSLIFNDLVSNIPEGSDFTQTKETIYNNFIKIKKDLIQKELLNTFNLSEDDVKKTILSEHIMKNPIVGRLAEQIAKYRLDTTILLVGFGENFTRIAEITEFGFADFGDIHFHAIGSGQMQAINTLLFQKQSKSDALERTIYNVYKAKKNAEVSSGVGKETDMLILTERDCYEISNEDLDNLCRIYERELDFGRNSEELNSLNILNRIKEGDQIVASQ